MTPKTTKTPEPETLEQRAERVAAELAEVDAERQRQHQAEAVRLAEHHADFDAAIVADYNPRDYDAAVDAARAALDAAIAADPITAALSDYYRAQAARREHVDRYLGALGRRGRDVSNAELPVVRPYDVAEAQDRHAQSEATRWRIAAEADFHHRRDTPTPKERTK